MCKMCELINVQNVVAKEDADSKQSRHQLKTHLHSGSPALMDKWCPPPGAAALLVQAEGAGSWGSVC